MSEESAAHTRLTLALLWTWALFNYVYGDILHIFLILSKPRLLAELQGGHVGGIPLNNMTTLVMAAGMQLSIMMVFLSWKLPHRLNRWLNIALGLLFTLVMAGILFASGGVPQPSGYNLYALIEICITLAIVRTAWTWRAGSTAG